MRSGVQSRLTSFRCLRTLALESEGQRHQPLHQPPAHARRVVGIVHVAHEEEHQLDPFQQPIGLGASIVRKEGQERQVRRGEGGQRRLGQIVERGCGEGVCEAVTESGDCLEWKWGEERDGGVRSAFVA